MTAPTPDLPTSAADLHMAPAPWKTSVPVFIGGFADVEVVVIEQPRDSLPDERWLAESTTDRGGIVGVDYGSTRAEVERLAVEAIRHHLRTFRTDQRHDW